VGHSLPLISESHYAPALLVPGFPPPPHPLVLYYSMPWPQPQL